MSWRSFEKILVLSGKLNYILLVDKALVDIIWLIHNYCGTEVLAYIRKIKEPEPKNKPDRTDIIYYVLTPNPFKDIHIPNQKASRTEVKVLDPKLPDPSYNYAVIHTHPQGVSRFSQIDREYINANHVVSILIENGTVKDASISFLQGKTSIQVTPEINIIQNSVLVKYHLDKLGIAGSALEVLLKDFNALVRAIYLKYLIQVVSKKIEGCRGKHQFLKLKYLEYPQ